MEILLRQSSNFWRKKLIENETSQKNREQKNIPKAFINNKQNCKIMKINTWFKLSNEISQFFYCPWQSRTVYTIMNLKGKLDSE